MSFDILNKTLQNSPLYKALVSASQSNKFLYTIKSSPAPYSKTNLRVNSRIQAIFNRDWSFLIPSQGLLAVAYLRVQLSGIVATDITFCQGGGIYLLHDHVDLVTKSMVIERIYNNSIMARVNALPSEIRDGYLSAVKSGITVVAGTDLSVSSLGEIWVPLFFSAFERPENFLDTRFIENLEIKLKSTSALTDIITSGTVTNGGITSAELCCLYMNPIEYAYEKLQSEQFTLKAPLSMLWNNQEKNEDAEAVCTLADSIVEFKMRIDTKKLVHAMHIFVKKVGNLGGDFENIENIKLQAMGTTLISVDGLELQIMQSRNWNRFNTKVDTSGANDNIYTLYFGLDDSMIENSGAIAFQSLNDPYIIVRARVQTTGTYKLKVVSNCWNIINIDGTSGEITRSLDK
jgi:hypothetical protein